MTPRDDSPVRDEVAAAPPREASPPPRDAAAPPREASPPPRDAAAPPRDDSPVRDEVAAAPPRDDSPVPDGVAAASPRRFGRRAALAGAALAAVSLRAAPARAASDEGGLLLGLWRREKGLAIAYGQQVHTHPELFGPARRHANDHAAAIATELAAVGLGTPQAPWTPADLDAGAHRLATSKPADALANAVLVEEGMVELYKSALLALPDANIAMTAATILASHAQHLFVLRNAAQVT